MLSRAKHGMYILGSMETVMKDTRRGITMFQKILNILNEQGFVKRYFPLICQNHSRQTLANCVRDFQTLASDGGCNEPCLARLPCGHNCKKLCHPDDRDHITIKCLDPCAKFIDSCGHPCKQLCFMECICKEIIPEFVLKCGHTFKNAVCHNVTKYRDGDHSFLKCKTLMKFKSPLCNHELEISCDLVERISGLGSEKSDLLESPLCSVLCEFVFPKCKHACSNSCGDCLRKLKNEASISHSLICNKPCERDLVCGHICGVAGCHKSDECPPCSQTCINQCDHSKCRKNCGEFCYPCVFPCNWECIHQGSCPLPCSSLCIRFPCDQRCSKILSCGHQCPSVCGEECPSSKFCRLCDPGGYDGEVDLILGTRLSQHDPDESPLLVISCGHAFTMESIDGIIELERHYKKYEGKWCDILPLDDLFSEQSPRKLSRKLKCPLCFTDFKFKRYNRFRNYFLMHNSKVKLSMEMNRLLDSSRKIAESATNLERLKKALDQVKQTLKTQSPYTITKDLESHYLENSFKLPDYLRNEWKLPLIIAEALILISMIKISVHKGNAKALLSYFFKSSENLKKGFAWAIDSKRFATAFDILYTDVRLKCAFLRYAGKWNNAFKQGSEQLMKLREKIVGETKSLIQTFSLISLSENQLKSVKEISEQFEKLSSDELTPEEAKMVIEAMSKEIGGVYGGFGSRWNMCRNGHPYVIGECGGAMQISTCPECKETIGGQSHALAVGNSEARDFLRIAGLER